MLSPTQVAQPPSSLLVWLPSDTIANQDTSENQAVCNRDQRNMLDQLINLYSEWKCAEALGVDHTAGALQKQQNLEETILTYPILFPSFGETK